MYLFCVCLRGLFLPSCYSLSYSLLFSLTVPPREAPSSPAKHSPRFPCGPLDSESDFSYHTDPAMSTEPLTGPGTGLRSRQSLREQRTSLVFFRVLGLQILPPLVPPLSRYFQLFSCQSILSCSLLSTPSLRALRLRPVLWVVGLRTALLST